MNIDLFCYGTLQFPEVLRAVTGRDFLALPAILHDHARYRVKGAMYPALIHEPGALTQGMLLLGIDPRSQQRLDNYEGPLYDKRMVTVQTDSGVSHAATTYVFKPERRHLLLQRDWEPDKFARRHLARYLRLL